MPRINSLIQSIIWSGLTIVLFEFGKALHHKRPRWWTSPSLLTPLMLILVTLVFHVTYQEYIGYTKWLITMLAPATVAFAIPIYEQQLLIRRFWPLLTIGAVIGSTTAIASSWALASLFGLDHSLLLSLLPRSMSTPFAMIVSGNFGGSPSLTAVFTVITGVFGATIGECLLLYLPLQSVLARGALFGMGAHGVGTAKAHQIDKEVGAISGLVMVLVGILNVLVAPFLAHFLF